jgi:hypothetical protein
LVRYVLLIANYPRYCLYPVKHPPSIECRIAIGSISEGRLPNQVWLQLLIYKAFTIYLLVRLVKAKRMSFNGQKRDSNYHYANMYTVQISFSPLRIESEDLD